MGTIFTRNALINGLEVKGKKDRKSVAVYFCEIDRLILVYCRTKWDDGSEKPGEENSEEGYTNLGKLVGASSFRGISSLHNQLRSRY